MRGIELPEGTPDSAPGEQSVWGLGNRKQLLVEDQLEQARGASVDARTLPVARYDDRSAGTSVPGWLWSQ